MPKISVFDDGEDLAFHGETANVSNDPGDDPLEEREHSWGTALQMLIELVPVPGNQPVEVERPLAIDGWAGLLESDGEPEPVDEFG